MYKDNIINIIQTFQNKVLRAKVNVLWYDRNADTQRYLGISTVKEEIKRFSKKHKARFYLRENAELLQLLDNQYLF